MNINITEQNPITLKEMVKEIKKEIKQIIEVDKTFIIKYD